MDTRETSIVCKPLGSSSAKRPDHVVSCRLAFQTAGVERNPVRAEFGFAHVDCYVAVFFHSQFNDARFGFDSDRIAICHVENGDESGKGARAIAALFHFATVGIENSVAEIGSGILRFFHYQDLVGTYTETPGRQ